MYVKGQHLRGVDSDLAERCRAEIVRAPSLTLELHNLHDNALLACRPLSSCVQFGSTLFGRTEELRWQSSFRDQAASTGIALWNAQLSSVSTYF